MSSEAGAIKLFFREAIARAVREEMAADARVIVLGQDVGAFGGSYKEFLGLNSVRKANGTQYVWLGGEWAWYGAGWFWVGGHWGYPPYAHAVWIGGRSWHDGHGWHNSRGHWR